jgi:hypothetical protein
MSKIVTIHQPDFMPWLGFFAKINRADTFVVLDHVVNRYNEQSWFRRVKLANRTSCYWFSISVEKPKISSHIPINQMRVNRKIDYKKSLKSIQQTYSKAPYYHTIYPLIEKWFNSNETLLSKKNMIFIIDIMDILEIDTKVVYSSELNCKEKSNELLIEILKLEGADIYLCGDGADAYQKDELFIAEGIKVEYNNFKIEEYNQINTKKFQARLSIIDSLMNIGSKETKKLIQQKEKYVSQ